MILLDAVYINQSGGKVLLEYFIKNIQRKGLLADFFFLFDSRLESVVVNEISSSQQLKIIPSERNRKKFYKTINDDVLTVFCFANVPPPVKLENRDVFILFHNALILNNKNMYYSPLTRAKFFLKRLYIKNNNNYAYRWIVQTKSMSVALSSAMNIPAQSIEILPFYEANRFEKVNQRLTVNNGNFLFVADGVKQKNHMILLAAWELVFDTYRVPLTLHLTVPPEYLILTNEIKRLKDKGINIINHGRCNFEELKALYGLCNFFINTSLTESFGLPLIESAEAGCEIISANLNYVYDIVNPLATFDPYNEKDIAEKIISSYRMSYAGKTKLIVTNKIYSLINLITKNV